MLLRRITEHIKTQNWFAVFVDFLVVVFGVFIGFQVDNWNRARNIAAQESEYITRLYNDVKTTIDRNEHQMDFMISQAEKSGAVLNSLRTCSVAKSDRIDVANGFYHLGKIFTVFLVQNTIDELLSTGNLAVIQNKNIRAQLDTVLKRYKEISGLIPLIFKRVLPHNEYVDSYVVFRIEKPFLGNYNIDWKTLEINLDELCQDRRFYTAVATIRSLTYDVIAQNEGAIREVKVLHRLLEEEIRLNAQ